MRLIFKISFLKAENTLIVSKYNNEFRNEVGSSYSSLFSETYETYNYCVLKKNAELVNVNAHVHRVITSFWEGKQIMTYEVCEIYGPNYVHMTL